MALTLQEQEIVDRSNEVLRGQYYDAITEVIINKGIAHTNPFSFVRDMDYIFSFTFEGEIVPPSSNSVLRPVLERWCKEKLGVLINLSLFTVTFISGSYINGKTTVKYSFTYKEV